MKAKIGIVIISHEKIAEQMLEVVRKIVRDMRPMHCVSMTLDESSRLWKDKLRDSIAAADAGKGVLLLADVYGATPFNVCKSFVEPGKVALVAGFNLPMLLKLPSVKKLLLPNAVKELVERSRKAIDSRQAGEEI